MSLKKLFLLFIAVVTCFSNFYCMQQNPSIITGAVFCKMHSCNGCYAGYFYDLRDQYHWGHRSNQNPGSILWNIDQIRRLYSNRCSMCSKEYCFEIQPSHFIDKIPDLHKPGHIFLTYHDKLWQLLFYEEVNHLSFFSPILIEYINNRLDPSAKPEGCSAKIKMSSDGGRIISFFSTSPLQCILSMPYDGPAFFTQKEFDYFSNFLDLTGFRNPAEDECYFFDNIMPMCLLQ